MQEMQISTIAVISQILKEHVYLLCGLIHQISEIPHCGRVCHAIMPIDDADSTDSQRFDVGDVKKLAIALISQILNEHAYLLCSLIHEIGDNCPHWGCLFLLLCLLTRQTVQICTKLMWKM